MVKAGNNRRRDVNFEVGELVYLKYRPHRHVSVQFGVVPKLATLYFGPFKIIAKIGNVAHKLQLPEGARVHPIFDISGLMM